MYTFFVNSTRLLHFYILSLFKYIFPVYGFIVFNACLYISRFLYMFIRIEMHVLHFVRFSTFFIVIQLFGHMLAIFTINEGSLPITSISFWDCAAH